MRRDQAEQPEIVGVPLPLAVKPNVVDAPAPTDPLYAAFVTVIDPLLADGVPLHRLEMLAPDGRDNPTRHPEIAALPAVTVTDPWNPPGQLPTWV